MNILVLGASVALLCNSLLYTTRAENFSTPPVKEAAQQDGRQISDASVQEKIKSLSSANPIERANAACALGSLKQQAAPAIKALINLLGDETHVDVEQMQCWGRKSRGMNIKGVNDTTTVGEQAAAALASIGQEAVEPLIAALKDNAWRVRTNAAFALGIIKDERTVAALISVINDSQWQVREQAAWGLGLKKSSIVVEPLVNALQDSDYHVRSKAAWALGLTGNSQSVEPLIAALKDENTEVREQAAWALGLRGDTRAVEPLVAALKDTEPHVREQSAWALGLKGDTRAVLPLISALKDEAADVREQAAWALGLKGDRRALEALNAALKDKDEGVREQAAWALRLLRLKGGVAVQANPDIDVDVN